MNIEALTNLRKTHLQDIRRLRRLTRKHERESSIIKARQDGLLSKFKAYIYHERNVIASRAVQKRLLDDIEKEVLPCDQEGTGGENVQTTFYSDNEDNVIE